MMRRSTGRSHLHFSLKTSSPTTNICNNVLWIWSSQQVCMLACSRQVRLPGGSAPVYTLSSRWLSLTICKHFTSLRICLSSLFFLIRRVCLDFDVSRTFRSLKFLISRRDRHKHTSIICVFCSYQQTRTRHPNNQLMSFILQNNSSSFNFYLFVTLKVNDVVCVRSVSNMLDFYFRHIPVSKYVIIKNYKAVLISFLEISALLQQERAYHTVSELPNSSFY